MALTREYTEAVAGRNLSRVKIMLKDSLLVDRTFEQFDEMIVYAQKKGLELWIGDDEDDEIFSDASQDLAVILAGLVNNFSRRRVNHLKRMIAVLYPPKPQNVEKEYEQKVIIRRTRLVVNEINTISKNKKAIADIISKIVKENQIESRDIDGIRNAALNIVSCCDNIRRK